MCELSPPGVICGLTEFAVGSRLCSERFSLSSPVFLPPQKSTFLSKFQFDRVFEGHAWVYQLKTVMCYPRLTKLISFFFVNFNFFFISFQDPRPSTRCTIFVEGGKPENPEKNPRRKARSRTNKLFSRVTRSRNRTQGRLVGGERTHHCAIPTPHYLN